ncbi:MAG: NmrA family NAD(P)-binding protein [Pseudonocardia sp.]|nr:NmrA family NAD(P)-binding protein [Pseudonocardia sp.]
MKGLLAGATGAIGGPLLAAMSAHGHHVQAIIRNPAGGKRIAEPTLCSTVTPNRSGSSSRTLVRCPAAASSSSVVHC